RRTKLVSLADKKTELHFVIKIFARNEHRRLFGVAPVLAVRPLDVRARDDDARRPPVITDRHVFVIRHQRIVRPEHRPDIRRVIDGAVEVGVIADLKSRKIFSIAYRNETFPSYSFLLVIKTI